MCVCVFIENCTGPGIRSTSGQSPAAGQAAAGAQGGAQQAQQEGPEPERRSRRRRRRHGKPQPRHRLPVAASNRLSTRRAERPGPRVRLCPALPAPAGRVSSGHGLGARRGRSSGAAGMKRPTSAFPVNPLPHSHASTVKKPTSLQNRRRRRCSFSSAPGGAMFNTGPETGQTARSTPVLPACSAPLGSSVRLRLPIHSPARQNYFEKS